MYYTKIFFMNENENTISDTALLETVKASKKKKKPTAKTISKPAVKPKKAEKKIKAKKVNRVQKENVSKKPASKKPKTVVTDFTKNKPFNSERLRKMMLATRYERFESLSMVAEKTGLSKSTFQQVEALGTCKPDVLAIICNWLRVPVQHFF